MGSTFSIPMTVMRVRGRVRHIRPLPSDSTTATVPVDAIARLAPLMATVARRKRSRRCARAAIASSRGSAVRSVGAPVIESVKIWRISSRLRWMAGTRMCEGMSPASCTMSSARSVSTAVMPWAARCSLSPISCVAMDLTLTTSVAPAARTRSVTIRLASAASVAQWTTPPRAVTAASSSTSRAGRSAMTWALIADPAVRRSSQSGSSAVTANRLSRMVPVARRRLARSWASASVPWAASGKVGPQRSGSVGAVAGWGRTRGMPRGTLMPAPTGAHACSRGSRRGARRARRCRCG